ncbi:hypothetical protein [Planosporangium thailandense]|nr:hypothetical protein [Planosporangium thailandense]
MYAAYEYGVHSFDDPSFPANLPAIRVQQGPTRPVPYSLWLWG